MHHRCNPDKNLTEDWFKLSLYRNARDARNNYADAKVALSVDHYRPFFCPHEIIEQEHGSDAEILQSEKDAIGDHLFNKTKLHLLLEEWESTAP